MKTTVELPDELLKEAKALAARRGETLREFIGAALADRLNEVTVPETAGRVGWRMAFGLARDSEVAAIDRILARDFETVDLAEWK